MYNISPPLPGPTHINDRAEINAIVIVVQNVEMADRIDFLIMDTYYEGESRAGVSNNAEEKCLDLRAHWLPSHTDTDPKKLHHTLWPHSLACFFSTRSCAPMHPIWCRFGAKMRIGTLPKICFIRGCPRNGAEAFFLFHKGSPQDAIWSVQQKCTHFRIPTP